MKPQRPTLPVILSPIPVLPDEVHLWTIHFDANDPAFEARAGATTPDERKRAARFRRPEDRDRYLDAHGALRMILADLLGTPPNEIRLSADERGKPFVADRRTRDNLDFNLSHSGDYALVAVARGRPVGVDVEQLRTLPDLEGVADRVCSPSERAALSALAGDTRVSAFFALWTRKESLAKATGEGIQAIVRDADDAASDRWTIVEVRDIPGYAACVAAEGTGWRLVRRS